MKKHLLTAIIVLLAVAGMAQDQCYWVFFTDKNNTQFDPYTYFDAKAIERYQQCGAEISMTETKGREDCFIVGLFAHWDLDSTGEGEGRMIWENGIETCKLSYVK